MANTSAILLMTAAMAAFAVTDALIKSAAEEIGALQCLMVISLLSLLLFVPLVWKGGDRLFSAKALSKPMIIRTLGEVFGSAGVVSALALLPLSTVSALLQAQPLVLTAAAAFFLSERVGWRRWAAVVVGFIGMMIILRPGTGVFELALLLPLLGVLGLTARDIGTRLLPATISTEFAASWALMTAGLVGTALTFAGPGWKPMAGDIWIVVLSASVSVSLAYWLITKALRSGEVSAVAAFRYTRIVFALTIAWFIFDERPDLAVWIGLAIIILSGLYSFWRERRLQNDVSV